MHVKFDEFNPLVKNVVNCQIDSLGEDMEKMSMKDSPEQEEKSREDPNREVQEVQEVQPTQPLPKDWRYATSHPKDLIINDISKGVTIRSKLHDIVDTMLSFHTLNPRI